MSQHLLIFFYHQKKKIFIWAEKTQNPEHYRGQSNYADNAYIRSTYLTKNSGSLTLRVVKSRPGLIQEDSIVTKCLAILELHDGILLVEALDLMLVLDTFFLLEKVDYVSECVIIDVHFIRYLSYPLLVDEVVVNRV